MLDLKKVDAFVTEDLVTSLPYDAPDKLISAARAQALGTASFFNYMISNMDDIMDTYINAFSSLVTSGKLSDIEKKFTDLSDKSNTTEE